MLIRTAVFLLTIFSFLTVNAQETDTTIYQVMEEMPRFPGCEALDTTAQAKIECAQKQFLAYIYRNVQYPLEARQLGNEGTVAVRFVVEKDGTISQPEILKNVEGGLGEEAVRVISQMDDLGLLWRPGRVDGKAVRAYVTVPVKFRLEEAPPYTMVGRDTVYTVFEKPPAFEGGDSSLQAYLIEQLDYPEVGNDSCLIGNFDVQILIDTRGDVRILNVTDYNDLGFDFWYEAVNAATSTSGNWQPARYEGRAVPAAYDLSLSFYPTDPSCDAVVENYQRAAELATEGMELFGEGEQEAGLEKMTEAVTMFPKDANFLYLRGQAYLEMNRMDEACADLSQARDIALVNWFDGILPIICK